MLLWKCPCWSCYMIIHSVWFYIDYIMWILSIMGAIFYCYFNKCHNYFLIALTKCLFWLTYSIWKPEHFHTSHLCLRIFLFIHRCYCNSPVSHNHHLNSLHPCHYHSAVWHSYHTAPQNTRCTVTALSYIDITWTHYTLTVTVTPPISHSHHFKPQNTSCYCNSMTQ